MRQKLLAFENINHDGNRDVYHTGEMCVEKGCVAPAGTWWSPLWCFAHNVERMHRITASLDSAVRRAEVSAMIDKATEDLRNWAFKDRKIIWAMVAAAGGTITFKEEDLEREHLRESVQTPGNGTQTWQVTLK